MGRLCAVGRTNLVSAIFNDGMRDALDGMKSMLNGLDCMSMIRDALIPSIRSIAQTVHPNNSIRVLAGYRLKYNPLFYNSNTAIMI
jgi:hypothetical protein